MSETPLHFAHPEWAMGLWIWLGLVLALLLLERRGSDAIDLLVGTALQDRLVDRPSRWRRWARLALMALSGFAMIVALMQPQWGARFVATPRVGAEIMIALDVSRSMLADDAKPTRLDRAKAEISDLLSYLDEDYVGLIAFAGRASVLSPMTPDKSFLRLALDSAGPHSVSRGGTRLAEPIRRAVAGMGPPGPAQRALILITDGEDHDSFALDAAQAAAEAGIKIIAIGFGDEAGSQIYVRDPKTGARSLIRDGDGQPVISRLDGELLRELALATDGAFVPAGTGVLDLASIYDAHIARLTRGQLDERGRTIRDEVYQGFVLLALICLVAAVSLTSGRYDALGASRSEAAPAGRGPAFAARGTASRNLWLCCSLALGLASGGIAISVPGPAFARAGASPAAVLAPLVAAAASVATAGSEAADPAAPAGSAAPVEEPASQAAPITQASTAPRESTEEPRARFNRANAQLDAGEPVAAAALFREARRDAVDDLELRYAATYNLGVAAVARADARVAENPGEALEALYEAADWFREATSMRPDDRDPRHNLDVSLRRALILADEIARRDERDVAAELDALISVQRARVGDSAGLLEEVVRGGELDAAEALRPAFRAAATAQRLIASDAETLADRIERERATLLEVAEAERSPEDALRIAQLEEVLVYLDSAISRMGQARRQLRQRRAERAYRRSASALSELKRARDPLRSPVDQIGVLLSEVGQLAQSTAALASQGLQTSGDAAKGAAPALPAFLTPDSVEVASAQLELRVEELAARLASAAAQSTVGADDGGAAAPGAPSPAEQAALREALVAAAPLVTQAAESMARATQEISASRFAVALREESEAGEALADAQERFFDLRQLLDATHADQARIAALAGSEEPEVSAQRAEYAPLLVDLQAKNLERGERLASLLTREAEERIAALAAEAEPMAAGDPADEAVPDAVAAERQRFELAEQLLALASGAMLETRDALAGDDDGAGPDWAAVHEPAERSAAHLDAIRTLFFTLAEHIRKLALDQVDLADRTQQAFTLETASPGPEARARVSALAPEQSSLEARGGTIADALFEQAESMPAEAAGEEQGMAPVPSPGPGASVELGEERARIRRAAEHVAAAQLAMRDAAASLEGESGESATVQPQQDLAVEELRQALELLSPPPPPEDQPQEGQDSPQEQGDQGEDSQQDSPPSQAEAEAQPAEPEDAEEEMGDPSQMLQGVRDREAERRRDREREAQQRRAQPVERDW